MKIAIIGAGASGIVASLIAKSLNNSLEIDLFDANKNIAKKILASGNGRCNISNTNLDSSHYLGEHPKFVDYVLREFDFHMFENFFAKLGLQIDIKENNKVYPLSNEAKSVTTLLSLALKRANVNILCDHFVTSLDKKDDLFRVVTNQKEYNGYSKVLISSGLLAAPQLNSTSIGVEIASKFGHTFSTLYPSLVGLKTTSSYNKRLQGLKCECSVSLYINKTFEEQILGDVLFTNYGVSGFAILDISQKASLALYNSYSVELEINFFPNTTSNNLANNITKLFKGLEEEKVLDILGGIISNKLAPVLLDICHIDKETIIKELNTKEIKKLSYQLCSWKIKVVDTQGFAHAEVCGGGVNTKEIDNKSFESKIVKNLYFSGEVLDIVGKRGGYNLHFAWASGYLAGKAMANQSTK